MAPVLAVIGLILLFIAYTLFASGEQGSEVWGLISAFVGVAFLIISIRVDRTGR